MNYDRNTVFISATEPILYDGCDYWGYWIMAFLCAIVGICLLALFALPMVLWYLGIDVLLFVLARHLLRKLAKYDPLAVRVYLRHIQWPPYLVAHGKFLQYRKPSRLMRTR